MVRRASINERLLLVRMSPFILSRPSFRRLQFAGVCWRQRIGEQPFEQAAADVGGGGEARLQVGREFVWVAGRARTASRQVVWPKVATNRALHPARRSRFRAAGRPPRDGSHRPGTRAGMCASVHRPRGKDQRVVLPAKLASACRVSK